MVAKREKGRRKRLLFAKENWISIASICLVEMMNVSYERWAIKCLSAVDQKISVFQFSAMMENGIFLIFSFFFVIF